MIAMNLKKMTKMKVKSKKVNPRPHKYDES